MPSSQPPTEQELSDMKAVMERTQSWIDTLQLSGLSERVVLQGIMTAVIERALVAGNVSKTLEWLQG